MTGVTDPPISDCVTRKHKNAIFTSNLVTSDKLMSDLSQAQVIPEAFAQYWVYTDYFPI